MSGGAGHGSVPRPEICRAAGAALPRSRPAVARSLAGLLLGLRRVHAGVSAWRQGDGDQHGGQSRAAHATVSGESAQSEVVAQYGVRLQRGVGPGGRHGGTARQRGDGVQAGADADGEDARHRPSRALPDVPLQQVPRLVFRPASARERAVPTQCAEGGLLPRLRDATLRDGSRESDHRGAGAQRLRGSAAGAELLRPADAVERQLRRSPALCPGESAQAGAVRRTGHPHRGRRDKLRPGAEVRLPGVVGHPHRRGEAGRRARLRHQRIPLAPA